MNLGVIERLVFVIDRLVINAATCGGVVLDFDCEIAADGLDKDAILDADVRVLAVDVHVPRCPLPRELLRRGKNKLVVAAVTEILQRALFIIDEPFEGLHLRRPLPDLKAHVKMRPNAVKLQEGGVLVVAVEIREILRELRVAEDRVFVGVKAVIALMKIVHREDILHPHRRAQPEVDVVAKQESLRTNSRHVTRHAVVVRRQPSRCQQRRFDAAELFLPVVVQQIKPTLQLRAVFSESLTNDFVSASFELR